MGENTAILTPGQREFLRGESDIDPKSSHGRMVRSRIRNRIRTAFLDFDLLYRELPEDDRKMIFGDGDLAETDPEIWNGVVSALALLYERLGETDRTDQFEPLLQSAVWRVLNSPRVITYTSSGRLGEKGEEPIQVEIDTSRAVDLGPVGEKINEERWGALDESDLEVIEALLKSKRGEALEAEFREYLSANVEHIRGIKERQAKALEEAVEEMLEDLDPDDEGGE